MFDNIIGQQKLVDTLVSDITTSVLPRSLLISGPCCSGKFTIALELARVLSCDNKNAEWSCQCNSCRYHRTLSHQNTLVLSQRSNLPEIRASIAVLKRFDKAFARYMFIRSVKKLIIRTNPLLWEHNDSKLAKISSSLYDIEEMLSAVHPDFQSPHEEIISIAECIEKCINDIISANILTNISIDMVRNASSWAYTSTDYRNKIIIIDNIDELSESCSNALLKILEEPPEHLHLILLARNKGSIIPTILSRVRYYQTIPRNSADSGLVLARIFREEGNDFRSIRHFFLAYSDINIEEMKNDCLSFIQLINDKSEAEDVIVSLSSKYAGSMNEFLVELVETMQNLHKNGEDHRQLIHWNELIHHGLSQYSRYNTNPELVLEHILAGMLA